MPASASVPPVIVVPPVKVAVPDSVRVPVPAFTSDSLPPPDPSWIVPVKEPEALAELPTVSVTSVAPPFWITGVPGVAFVERLLTVSLKPLRAKVPVLLAPKRIAFSDPAVVLRPVEVPSSSVPALMARSPVKVFTPASVTVPEPVFVSVPPPFSWPRFRSVPCWATNEIVAAEPPSALPPRSSVPPESVTVAVSVPPPAVRTMLPRTESVPPLTFRFETAVRLATALAMLIAVPVPVPIVTEPPETLNVPVEVPPPLVFTAITRLPIVAVPPPSVAVAVALPVPAPVRSATFSEVTSKVPWLKPKLAVAAPELPDRDAIVIVPTSRSAGWPVKSSVPAMSTVDACVVFTRLTVVARDVPSEPRIWIVPVVSAAANVMRPLPR